MAFNFQPTSGPPPVSTGSNIKIRLHRPVDHTNTFQTSHVEWPYQKVLQKYSLEKKTEEETVPKTVLQFVDAEDNIFECKDPISHKYNERVL